MTFFRVYENGQPARLDNYLKWSTSGVKDGELVFVSGHPGSTGRLSTMAQLEFLRDTAYPLTLESLARRAALLHRFSATSAENARIAQEDIFSIENSLKAIKGYQSGLLDRAVMAQQGRGRSSHASGDRCRSAKRAEYGDPFAEISKAMSVQKEIYLPLFYIERLGGFRSDLAGIARALVRAADERAKPNGERLREYRDTALPSLEQALFSTAPIYKSLDALTMGDALAEMKEKMPGDPIVNRVLGDKAPAELAQSLIAGTRLDDIAVRKQLYEGGQQAVQRKHRSADRADARAQRRVARHSQAIRRRSGRGGAQLRRDRGKDTLCELRGAAHIPTPHSRCDWRMGPCAGSRKAGKASCPRAPRFRSSQPSEGRIEHAAEHNNQDPYQLPDSWMKSKSKANLRTPLNIVQTADIIGGNSGSPVVNRAGEVVGIIFDGNIQSLPWNFVYDDAIGRAIHVDSRGILEAVRNIYGASTLADELQGKTARR